MSWVSLGIGAAGIGASFIKKGKGVKQEDQRTPPAANFTRDVPLPRISARPKNRTCVKSNPGIRPVVILQANWHWTNSIKSRCYERKD